MPLPKVLLVDDLKQNYEIAGMVLEQVCELVWADNGKAAIEKLQSGLRPDLILLDIMMPVMNGYDACRIIKSDPDLKHIPILFITALGEVRDDQLGIDLGASDYIIRPFSPAILRARVTTYLKLNSNEKETERSISERTNELSQDKLKLIECLAVAIDSRLGSSQAHIKRVADYACVIAKAAGLNDLDVSSIRIAALLHDVGKLQLPDSVLKHEHADLSDRDLIKKHSENGAAFFEGYSGHLFNIIKEVAKYHHEKWDGTGFPSQLKANEIPLSARIVAIADSFDRKTSGEAGQKVWNVDDAIKYIEHRAGDYYDPMLVHHLAQHRSVLARICQGEYISFEDKKTFKLSEFFKPKHH